MLFKNEKDLISSVDLYDTRETHFAAHHASDLDGLIKPWAEYSQAVTKAASVRLQAREFKGTVRERTVQAFCAILLCLKFYYIYQAMSDASGLTLFWEMCKWTMLMLVVVFVHRVYESIQVIHDNNVILREGLLGSVMLYDRFFCLPHFRERLKRFGAVAGDDTFVDNKYLLRQHFKVFTKEAMAELKYSPRLFKTFERTANNFFQVIVNQYNSNDHFVSNLSGTTGAYDEDYKNAKALRKANRRN